MSGGTGGRDPVLELDGVVREFGDVRAVDDLSLSVDAGELVCLLGPSGCGKSTTLRTVAGFETPDAGAVRIDGRDVTGLAPNERATSMVFQDWALFPNKTVLENVAFGLAMDGVDTATRHDRAREMLELVEMAGHADDHPDQLSGGQKQRVALARSLAVDPELLLLDEPLSNLDRKLREAMQLEIAEIQAELGTTMLYVTHDQDEAFTLADRIAIVNEGRIVQSGPPAAVYTDPDHRFVESFLGTTNFLSCTVARDGDPPADRVALATPLGEPLYAPTGTRSLDSEEAVTASIRPERLSLSADPADRGGRLWAGEAGGAAETTADGAAERSADGEADARADDADADTRRERAVADDGATTDGGETDPPPLRTTGEVTRRLHRGSRVRYEVRVGEATLVTERGIDRPLGVAEGDTVGVGAAGGAVNYFDGDGRRLR
ncbi:ABC transporter ATP-binding protein [Halobaculum sp. MBLA0147]|uniref:ABC transporter ATP-binding protein n=1 Tax=Halobaculum sp. MBLA0147 TaxID=3079934 RepID=UPI0035234F29